LLPSRVLVVGCMCLGDEPGPKTITHLAKMMSRANQGQLHMLYGILMGPAHNPGPDLEPPSEWQLYRLFDALATVLGGQHRPRELDGLTGQEAGGVQAPLGAAHDPGSPAARNRR
jgi:hypothetical protein